MINILIDEWILSVRVAFCKMAYYSTMFSKMLNVIYITNLISFVELKNVMLWFKEIQYLKYTDWVVKHLKSSLCDLLCNKRTASSY